MADDNPLSSYLFWGNDPNVNQQLRQRLALQMMASKKAYPKNLGEGLSAIGDAIGEIGVANRLERGDLAQQAAARDAAKTLTAPPPVKADEAPPVKPDADTPPPPEQPPAGPMAATASPLVTAPAQPSSMLAPTLPTSLGNETAAPAPAPVPQGDVFSTGAVPLPYPTGDSNIQRDRMAALLVGRSGVPQSNPTQAEADAPPLSQATDFSAQRRRGPGGPPDDAPLEARPVATERVLAGAQPAPPGRLMPPPAAPAQLEADFGHVMAAPSPPVQPPPTPYDPRELQAARMLAANPNNPYLAQSLAPIIGPLKQAREMRDAQNQKQYEGDLILHREMMARREEQIAGRAKNIVEGQQAVQTLNQPKTMKTETGEDVYFNERTRTWDPIPRGGPPPDPNQPPNVKLNEVQQKALNFYTWAKTASDSLQGKDTLLAHGLGQELAGKVPFVGSAVQTNEYRRAKTAADNFILAFMRSTSGAAYGEKERLDHAHAMLPKYGDDAATLADKAAQRKNFLQAEMAGLPAPMKDFLLRQHATELATNQRQQDAINIEMQGVQPQGIGDVKTNKKTGARRMWNGANWIDVGR